MSASPAAMLDANVIYPRHLRDVLFWLAAAGYYRMVLSDGVLDELTGSLVRKGAVPSEAAAALRSAVVSTFPDAIVSQRARRHLVGLQNDPKDHHVVAAALEGEADIIVTFNGKDFIPLPAGVMTAHPDTFLIEILEGDPKAVIDLLRLRAEQYRIPLRLSELLERLERAGVTSFSEAIRKIL